MPYAFMRTRKLLANKACPPGSIARMLAVEGGYFPFHTGSRFSAKAFAPSN